MRSWFAQTLLRTTIHPVVIDIIPFSLTSIPYLLKTVVKEDVVVAEGRAKLPDLIKRSVVERGMD